MPDYLVKLYELPPLAPAIARLAAAGYELRPALVPEKSIVSGWVRENFSGNWADECDVAFARQPCSCLIATAAGVAGGLPDLVGFACYNSIFKGFFGPTGTAPAVRGRGIGTALLLSALHAMRTEGYVYGVIGSGGGAERFYQKTIGAVAIPGSDPGPYKGILLPLDDESPADEPGVRSAASDLSS